MKKWSIEELEEHFKVPFYKKIDFDLYFKNNSTIIRVRTLAIYNDMFNQEWFILDEDFNKNI